MTIDGLDNLKNISLELALKKVEEGKADPVEMAKKLGIGLEEFEEIAVERGIMDGITVEEIIQQFEELETLKKKKIWPQ